MNDYIGKITCADCLDILKQLPDCSVDLVCTDCPYRICSGGCTTGIYGNESKQREYEKDLETGRMLLKGTKHINLGGSVFNDDSKYVRAGTLFANNEIKFEDWLPEIYRVLKDNTHCYIMINGRNLAELQKQAEKVGFIYQNLLVWEKGNATPNKFYLNACEFILMLRKGGERWINNMGTKTILKVPNQIGDKPHPTAKPIELMEVLIANSTNENDIVLEPFAGGGATCIAAKKLKRRFIGVEIDPEYCEIANQRLAEEDRQQYLF